MKNLIERMVLLLGYCWKLRVLELLQTLEEGILS